MEKNNDFSFLRQILSDFFGTSESSFTRNSLFISGDLAGIGFPKDGDKNFNKVEEVTETETHTVIKETWTSVDGKSTFLRTVSKAKGQPTDDTKEKIERLEKRIDDCIRKQEFEEAARIRDEIKALKTK